MMKERAQQQSEAEAAVESERTKATHMFSRCQSTLSTRFLQIKLARACSYAKMTPISNGERGRNCARAAA